jgi:CheY-like chemotaxis protein
MDERDAFREQIRDALTHLYDRAHLECHPLVSQLLGEASPGRITRAQRLRSVLRDAIDVLQPQQRNASLGAPEWRSYLALHALYVKGENFVQLQDELGISRRQLQRELRKGLDAISAILWERRVSAGLALDTPPQDVLQAELESWELKRQACALETLVADTRWLLNPLLDRHGVTLHVQFPATSMPVYVDPTLARQALFRVLRLLVQNAAHQVTMQAIAHDTVMDLCLDAPGTDIVLVGEDWDIAELLIGRQGGELAGTGTSPSIAIRLPVAHRARVLVIDDVEAAHRLFERYLAPHNYAVVSAQDGPTGLKLARDSVPDLILLDVMMPTLDGWQVLRALQAEPATAAIPVVICSVLDEPELALSLGARAFVKKPVSRLALLNTLERILDGSVSAEEARPVWPPAPCTSVPR